MSRVNRACHERSRGIRKTLASVADCAGPELTDRVAEQIKDRIRSEEERPANRVVRRNARMLLTGEGIVADEYLNVARLHYSAVQITSP